MQPKYNIVIADATCFIILDKVSQFNLLEKLFTEVATTPFIAQEFGKPLPDWIKIIAVRDLESQSVLELEVDKGEASAISLALEIDNSLLILDDLKGRKLADRLNLVYTGTFGLLLRAKEEGIIDAIKPIMERIQTTNFRFSLAVIKEILRLAGEE